MRLIDADKLIDDLSYLKKSPWANEPWLSDQRKLGMREAIDMIQSIVRVDSQTVDAVLVIRCKDCRYFETNHWEKVNEIPLIVAHEICTRWGEGCKTAEDGYCFMAKRKEE